MVIDEHDADIVIGVARAAGDLVRRMYRSGAATVKQKSSEIDLVTAADVAAEGFIRDSLARLYPAVALWGEESNQQPDSEYFWLVDPIDGTTNFAHDIAYCSVNIALAASRRDVAGGDLPSRPGRDLPRPAGQRRLAARGERRRAPAACQQQVDLAPGAVDHRLPLSPRRVRGQQRPRVCLLHAAHDLCAQSRLGRAGPGARGCGQRRRLLGGVAQPVGPGGGRVARARGGRPRDDIRGPRVGARR